MTDDGGVAAVESWDGKSIYYSKVNTICGSPIYERPLDGGPERKIIDSACGRAFAVTNRGIYYTDGMEKDRSLRVRVYDPAAGVTRIIATTRQPLYGPHVLTVSPRGGILLTGSAQTGADLFLVENFR